MITEALFGPDPSEAQHHTGMLIAEIALNLRYLTQVTCAANESKENKEVLQRRMPIRHLEKTLGRVSD